MNTAERQSVERMITKVKNCIADYETEPRGKHFYNAYQLELITRLQDGITAIQNGELHCHVCGQTAIFSKSEIVGDEFGVSGTSIHYHAQCNTCCDNGGLPTDCTELYTRLCQEAKEEHEDV